MACFSRLLPGAKPLRMARDRILEMNAINFSFLACAIITMGLRLYVRKRIIKSLGSDDIVMTCGVLACIVWAVFQYISVCHGLGRHLYEVDIPEILSALKYLRISYFAYSISITLVRISVGLFLLRFTIERSHRWIIYILMGSTVFFGIWLLLAIALVCQPLGDGRHCIPTNVDFNFSYPCSAAAILIDFAFTVFPIFLTWSLNISTRTKIILIPIFGMASLTSIAVICRIVFVQKAQQGDFLYVTIDTEIWTTVELGLATLAGNLLTTAFVPQVARAMGISPSDDRPSERKLKSIVIRASRRSAGLRTGSSSKTDKSSITMSEDDTLPLHTSQSGRLAEESGDAPFADIGLDVTGRKKDASKNLDIESGRARLSIIPE